ncbi:type II CAAX endopeptidase family protein [Natrinema sp. 1APR25-10V2]|uniref:CPBP family intramembrane glutamic endopeptidase n=1 Tax=Natrinema sp. 1APR25-10V2 TaxID=2951081 RepID=UPI0028764C4E|nr:type II CAAX endopeptidase family protein [Natrinema sp. 1APR25-10V2]MDS0477193.1 CPBP family intramembrane metalloprotease [Natrinema sp. 1APR25-10V2]
MSNVRSRLRSLVRSQQSDRVRAVWRVLLPVLAGFLTLQFVIMAALTLNLNRGQMMVAGFAGTTLVMTVVLGVSARYLDRRPIREYGYRLSRDWWCDLTAGTGIGALVVALTFVIARHTGSLQVTSSGLVPGAASLGWLLAFFAAFAGVAFYEEFIYRGAFVTNAVEGLVARGVTRPVATGVALLASTFAFAFVHVPGAIAAGASITLVIAKTGLLGGLFGVAYLRTGELALPMGLHLGVNYALMNVFGIGAAGVPGIPTLLTVEHTATGLWNPARGIPLLVAILGGYVLVAAWTQWREYDRTARQYNRLTYSHSDS